MVVDCCLVWSWPTWSLALYHDSPWITVAKTASQSPANVRNITFAPTANLCTSSVIVFLSVKASCLRVEIAFIMFQNLILSNSTHQDSPHLHAMNTCLRDLLSLWFSVGFLGLERITWESPCDMLQKVGGSGSHPVVCYKGGGGGAESHPVICYKR